MKSANRHEHGEVISAANPVLFPTVTCFDHPHISPPGEFETPASGDKVYA